MPNEEPTALVEENKEQSRKSKAQKHLYINKNGFDFSMQPLFLITVIIILGSIGIGSLCQSFYRELSNMIYEESNDSTSKTMLQVEINIKSFINENFKVLQSTSQGLSSQQTTTLQDVTNYLGYQKDLWQYEFLAVLDQQGRGFQANGESIGMRQSDWAYPSPFGTGDKVITILSSDDQAYLLLYTPMSAVSIDSLTLTAMIGAIDLKNIQSYFGLKGLNQEFYTQIIDPEGNVMRQSNESSRLTKYNVLDELLASGFLPEEQYEALTEGINAGQQGMMEYGSHDQWRRLIYSPVGQEGEYLLTIFPHDFIDDQFNLLFKKMFGFCFFISWLFIVLLTVILLNYYSNKQRLERMAYIDPLTQSNSRQGFICEATSLLKKGKRPYAIVYLNLVQFKIFNERYGYDQGDALLIDFVNVIQKTLVCHETMGRINADRFAVLLTYADEMDIVQQIERWDQSFAQCHSLYDEFGHSIQKIQVRYGIYMIGEGEYDVGHLLDYAILASQSFSPTVMQNYSFYDDRIKAQLLWEKELEDMMQGALENGEFVVHLQPKYDTYTAQIVGAEALIRWDRGEKGMIYPSEFIPIFERNGFIRFIDLYVFEETCKLIAKWIGQGRQPVTISVNLSRYQLIMNDGFSRYKAIYTRYNIPPQYIELEITETLVVNNLQSLQVFVDQAHQVGFKCAMDDFGSGYSSLNVLQSLPIDTLKLDKSFFKYVDHHEDETRAIVQLIIGLAKQLNMYTVAEGVEKWQQVDDLRTIGCQCIQGYIFSSPVAIEQFENMLYGAIEPQ